MNSEARQGGGRRDQDGFASSTNRALTTKLHKKKRGKSSKRYIRKGRGMCCRIPGKKLRVTISGRTNSPRPTAREGRRRPLLEALEG